MTVPAVKELGGTRPSGPRGICTYGCHHSIVVVLVAFYCGRQALPLKSVDTEIKQYSMTSKYKIELCENRNLKIII